MMKLAERGLMPSFHIHDEVVIPISAENAEETLKTIEDIMVLDADVNLMIMCAKEVREKFERGVTVAKKQSR